MLALVNWGCKCLGRRSASGAEPSLSCGLCGLKSSHGLIKGGCFCGAAPHFAPCWHDENWYLKAGFAASLASPKAKERTNTEGKNIMKNGVCWVIFLLFECCLSGPSWLGNSQCLRFVQRTLRGGKGGWHIGKCGKFDPQEIWAQWRFYKFW